MALSGKENKAVQELSEAVNAAIEQSPVVADALENLRRLGYEANLNLKLEVGLQEIDEQPLEPVEEIELELTEDDLRTLRRMKIRIED